MMYISKVSWDVLHGLVVKNKPFNAWDLGPIPGWRTKIPHAEGQLSPCVSTAQRVCSATRERPQSTARTQHSQKKKKKKKKKNNQPRGHHQMLWNVIQGQLRFGNQWDFRTSALVGRVTVLQKVEEVGSSKQQLEDVCLGWAQRGFLLKNINFGVIKSTTWRQKVTNYRKVGKQKLR